MTGRTTVRNRRRWLFGVAAALLTPVALFAALIVRLIVHEHSLNEAPTRGRLAIPTAETGVAGIREVQIPVAGEFEIGAWYVPPRHGAAVILTHGIGADRSQMLPEIKLLTDAGIGVLAFDWPGNGTSGGESQWGRNERLALGASVTWLSAQPDVDRAQIGALGFSSGGYTVAQVAATDVRIRRIALVGTPSDAAEQTIAEYKRYGRFAGWVTYKANQWMGIEPDTLKAKDLVSKFAPRPLLLISGALDQVVPMEMADTLLARAAEPKALIRFLRAVHGNYIAVDSATYGSALRRLFMTGSVHDSSAAAQH